MSTIMKGDGRFSYAPPEDVSFKLEKVELRSKGGQTKWELSLQFLDRYMMLVVASGQGSLTVDGRFIELREGGIYFWSPGQLVGGALRDIDERGFFALSFDVIEHQPAAVPSGEGGKRQVLFPLEGEVLAMSPVSVSVMCERMKEHLESGEALQRFRAQIYFQELLFRVFSEVVPAGERAAEAALDATKEYIERNYQHELSIDQLAKVAGISERHFMRLFKKRFGCSAIDYLANYRIGQAQQLMRAGGPYRLKDIARHVGYQDDAYFRRKFRQISGIPPAAFMKNSRLKIAAYDSAMIGHLLALRVAPCAAPADNPWTDYYLRKFGADRVLALSEDSALKLGELRKAAPDFILASELEVSPQEHAVMSSIAQTLLVTDGQSDWRSQFKRIAVLLGKMAEADTWLARYERKVDFVGGHLRSTMRTDRLLLLKLTGQGLEMLGCRSVGAVFYEDLGLTPAGEGDAVHLGRSLTLHELADLSVDRILLFVDKNIPSAEHELKDSEEWMSLPVVREGKVDTLSTYPWLDNNAFTHEMLLDEVWKLWRDRA